MSEDLNAENIIDNWERIQKLEALVKQNRELFFTVTNSIDVSNDRIQKLEAKVATLEQQITSLNLAIEALAQSDEKLGYRLVFFEELGIEKHLADHNREMHEREMSLDFKNSAGLSRAGLE